MAEKISGNDKEDGGKKKKAATVGHNRAELTKKLAPFLKDVLAAYDTMEEDHGSHVLTISHKFEKISESTGFPKGMIRSHVAKIRRAMKEEEKEKAMSEEEREETVMLRDALASTPFGKYLDTKLASA